MFTFPDEKSGTVLSIIHGPRGYLNEPLWCEVSRYVPRRRKDGMWVWDREATLYRGPCFEWSNMGSERWVRMGDLHGCMMLPEDLALMVGLNGDAPAYVIHDRMTELGLETRKFQKNYNLPDEEEEDI